MRHGSDMAYIMLGNHSVGMVYDFWNEFLSTRSSNGFFDAYVNDSMMSGGGSQLASRHNYDNLASDTVLPMSLSYTSTTSWTSSGGLNWVMSSSWTTSVTSSSSTVAHGHWKEYTTGGNIWFNGTFSWSAFSTSSFSSNFNGSFSVSGNAGFIQGYNGTSSYSRTWYFSTSSSSGAWGTNNGSAWGTAPSWWIDHGSSSTSPTGTSNWFNKPNWFIQQRMVVNN